MRSLYWTLLAAVACGGEPTRQPEPAPLPVTVQVTRGMNQVAAVRTELPDTIVARVIDALGQPISGQLVSFVVMTGGGHAFAAAAVTNALGEAKGRWRLGDTAMVQVLEVRALDPKTRARVVFAKVDAFAEPATVDTLLLRSADTIIFVGQKVVLPDLVTRISDRYGNSADFRRVTVAVTASWLRSADTIWAAHEGEGTATFTAGSQTKVVSLRAIEDLRPYRWHIRYACAGVRLTNPPSDWIDSTDVKAVADNVSYRGYPGFPSNLIDWVNVTFNGTREEVRYFASGVVDTIRSPYNNYFTQRPDSLIGWWLDGVSLRTVDEPPRYEGGTWCRYEINRNGIVLRAPVMQAERR